MLIASEALLLTWRSGKSTGGLAGADDTQEHRIVIGFCLSASS